MCNKVNKKKGGIWREEKLQKYLQVKPKEEQSRNFSIAFYRELEVQTSIEVLYKNLKYWKFKLRNLAVN